MQAASGMQVQALCQRATCVAKVSAQLPVCHDRWVACVPYDRWVAAASAHAHHTWQRQCLSRKTATNCSKDMLQDLPHM